MRFSFVFMVLGIVSVGGDTECGLNLFEGYERTLKTVLLDSFSHITLQSQLNEYLSREQVDEAAAKLSKRKEIANLSANISYSAMVQDGESIRVL
jgi:ABC-type lipoprotein release transport system permease subunit